MRSAHSLLKEIILFFPFHSHSPISVSWYWANMQTPQCILWSLSITLRWWYTLPSSQLTFWGCWNANMTSRLPKQNWWDSMGLWMGWEAKRDAAWFRVIFRDFLVSNYFLKLKIRPFVGTAWRRVISRDFSWHAMTDWEGPWRTVKETFFGQIG